MARLSSALLVLLLAIVVEIAVRATGTPVYIVPPPSLVVGRLFGDPEFFLVNAVATVTGAVGGLVVGGGVAVMFATLMAHSTTAERTLMPLAILVKVTPVVALTPLFIIWLGFGWPPIVLTSALFAFFPILVGTIGGLRFVDSGALAFLRSIGATRAEVFWKLRVPSALPHLTSATRVALPLALIGAVIAEWLGSDRGLGHVVGAAHTRLDLPTLAAAVVVLAGIGAAMTGALALLERRILFWQTTD